METQGRFNFKACSVSDFFMVTFFEKSIFLAYFETKKVFSLLNLMDTFLNPLKPKEVGLATGGSTTRVKSSSSLGEPNKKY